MSRKQKTRSRKPDHDEQRPHRRFVAVCGPCFSEQQKCSGLALLHFRLYQLYQIFIERIARHAVALRVSGDDEVKFLRQPLFTESAVAETGVKVRDRQYHLIGIKRFVGDIVFHQQFGGGLGRCCYMCFDVFADTVRKRKFFVLQFSQLQCVGEISSKRNIHEPMVVVEKIGT